MSLSDLEWWPPSNGLENFSKNLNNKEKSHKYSQGKYSEMMWHNLSRDLQKVKSQILRNDHLESTIREKDINLAVVFLQMMKMTPIVVIL